MKTTKDKNLTILGEKTEFDGTMGFTDELHIVGSFRGSIHSTGFLLIAPEAQCSVNYIKAADVVVEGTVRGSITASNSIEMKAGSRVYGDVTAARIKIADEVLFEGSVKMIDNPLAASRDMFTLSGDALKDRLRSDAKKH